MAHSYEQLSALSDEQLISEYNRVALYTDPVGLTFLRDELFRREVKNQNEHLDVMTRQIRWLTIAIAVLTLVSTAAIVFQILHP